MEDASQLNNVLPADIKPTVIVMNPPFSATAGRVLGRRKTSEGAKHIEQALLRLQPNGRLVAIVGKGMADDAPAFKDWWKKIKQKYFVRANIGVSGKEYTKYGTSFDNQLLIIDKITPEDYNEVVTGNVDSVEDILPLIKGIIDDRISITKQSENKSGIQESTSGTKSILRPRDSVLSSTGEMGGGQRGSTSEVSAIDRKLGSNDVLVETGIGDEVSGRGKRSRKRVAGREGSPSDSSGNIEPASQPLERDITGIPDSEQPASELQVGVKKQGNKGEFTEGLYASYTPEKVNIPGAKPHPTKLVQSAAMAAVSSPDPNYKPSIPDSIVKAGKLSDIQLESIVYAGQAHNEILPDGVTRKGYFIGDGTGVGKGREISGIFMDNWNKGRKKGVWISEKKSLFEDAQRDISGIGWDKKRVFDHGKIKASESIGAKEGILFTTYDTLKSKAKDVNLKSRLEQIIDWLGTDFDGVIAFDEAHNMGNAIAVKGERGSKQPSAKALAGVELQRRLPNARIVYVSATGATEVINLAYADRLGLWGEGTAFPDKGSFIENISSGGVAAMELVARDMKAFGVYNARSLSYDGVEQDKIIHELSDDQREIYDKLAEGWQNVLRNINAALELTGAIENGKTKNSHAKAAAYSAFWGAHQRFFNQIITSMQTPSVINAIHKDIEKGNAVVIQLVNTMEAAQERAIATLTEDDSLEDLDLTPRDSLMQFIEKSFPVTQYQEYSDEDGNIRTRPMIDSKGNPAQNMEAVAMRDALLDEVGSIKVPDSPIDMIIDEFGADNVAEITGRRRRVVTIINENGNPEKVIESRSKAKTSAEADAFMNDKRKILLFSEAGGTGRSYHADLNAKNQRKRIHYLLQAGWRADKAIQGLGRTHRSNQAQPPQYFLVTTDLKGQKRFISSIARRLDQLGALTKGQRQTGSQGIFDARDNLESDYANDALKQLFHDLYHRRVETISIGEFETQTGLKLTDEKGNMVQQLPTIRQFLNRLLSLKIDTMNSLFDEFSIRMDEVIKYHAENGTLDQGLETLKANKIEKVSEQLIREDKTGAETKYVQLDVTNPSPILDYETAQKFTTDGFWQNNKSGKVWAVKRKTVTDRKTGELNDTYILISPTYSENRIKVYEHDPENWTILKDKQAKDLWENAISSAPKTVTERKHLITGVLLPIWDRLSGYPRIMRIQTSEGEQMIGRLIPPAELKNTLNRIGAESQKIQISASEIHQKVLDQGYRIELANKWEITRRKVSGDDRIELEGPDYRAFNILEKYGVFSERINYNTRYFIPVSEQGIATIENIIDNHPVVTVTAPIDVDAAKSHLIDKLRDERGSISFEAFKGEPIYQDLITVGKHIYSQGYTKFEDFSAKIKATLKDVYDKISHIIKEIWNDIKTRLADERGSLSFEDRRKLDAMFEKYDVALGKITKESKLAKRVREEAEEANIPGEFENIVDYETRPEFMKDQKAKAAKVLDSDYELAKKIAMGEAEPPIDIMWASIYNAVKRRAETERDWDTLYDIGAFSEVPEKLSKYGQQIKSADESDPDDPLRAMRDIEADRKGKNKKQGKKIVSLQKVKELKRKLAEAEEKLKQYESKPDKEKSEAGVDSFIKNTPKSILRKGSSKSIADKLKALASESQDLFDMTSDIQELARYFISKGITTRGPLVEAVHGVIKDIIPGITLRETQDAISGYGKFRPLSKDEISAKLRDLKGQMQQVSKLEDMQQGKAPLKTGFERRIPSDEERRLIRQVEEMKKELGIETVDPERQLKSALDSVKTRLSNQIKDLEYQISTKEKIVKKRIGLKYDVEAENLKKRRDELRVQFDELFGKPTLSEDKRIQMAIKAVNKSIEEYTRRINDNDLTSTVKRTPVQSEELNKLREIRDDLKAKVKELKDLAKPKKTAEEIALQRLKTRLTNETKKLTEKLETLDFEKAENRETVLDNEARKLKKERDTIKKAYNAAVESAGIVTREEADRLMELSEAMKEAREEMEAGGDRFKYGAAKVAFIRFIEHLKGSDKTIKTLLNDEWKEVKAAWRDNKPSAFTKSAKDIIQAISDLSISLMASMDNSFLGRQGLNTLLTHPSVWAPAAKKSFVDIYRTMVSKHGGQMVRDAVMADAYSRPNYINGDYNTAKLIPKSEEQFPTSIPERIPFLGRVFKASENAFLNSGVRMRINTYDLLKNIAEAQEE